MPGHASIPPSLTPQPLQPQAQLASQGTAGGMSQPSSAAPVSDASMSLQPDGHQLYTGDFSGLGMDGGNGDLNPDLAALAQSLPFSGSEMNLAGMVNTFACLSFSTEQRSSYMCYAIIGILLGCIWLLPGNTSCSKHFNA